MMNMQLLHETQRSLMHRPGLSVLVIATISIGIALMITMQTTVYQQMRVPLPHISQDRYMLTIDMRSPDQADPLENWQLPSLAWVDAQNLMQMQTPAKGYSANFRTSFVIETDELSIRPNFVEGIATDHHFFTMFGVPFLYGSGWTESATSNGEAVIVISKKLNEKLFGGADSVGTVITSMGVRTTIIGVLDEWPVKQVFYDRSFSDRHAHDIFVPMSFAMQNNFTRNGYMVCNRSDEEQLGNYRMENIQGLMASNCGWIHFWVALTSQADAQDYQQIVQQYVTEQKNYGRFSRDNPDIQILNVNQQLDAIGGDDWAETLLVMAYLFFAVCLVNTVGILLAKFLNHTKRVSLYRALGATKSYILKQHLLEVVVLGLTGGLLGLFLSYWGLELMFQIEMYQMDYHGDPEVVRQFFTLDWSMVSAAILVSICSVIVAGLYPIWKICNIPPATQLKS